jgi:hypothetical protein
MCLPPDGTSARALAPLLVNCLTLKLTMLFRLLAAILARSTRQPPGCCVFSPSELVPCSLFCGCQPQAAVQFPHLRRPNGAEPCLLPLPGGGVCVPQALPTVVSGWATKLQTACRAILLRRVPGLPTWYHVNTRDTAAYAPLTINHSLRGVSGFGVAGMIVIIY